MELSKEDKALLIMGLQLVCQKALAENQKQMVRKAMDLQEQFEQDLQKILEAEKED